MTKNNYTSTGILADMWVLPIHPCRQLQENTTKRVKTVILQQR